MDKVLLIDICDIQYGYAFDSNLFSDTKGKPLVRIRDVVRGYSETYTTEECPDNYIVHNGDILIGMDGEFNIALWKGGEAVLNQRVCKLIPHNKICKNYVFYYMPIALKAIENKTPFVTVKHLSAKELNKIEIPLTTYEEQSIIANSLHKLDELIVKRKQQLSKLDELVKARFVELFGDPVDNPMGWSTKQLQELVTDDCTISYGIVQTGDDQEDGVPVFRPVDIVNRIPVRSELKKTTEEISNKYKRTILKGREMLITVRANIADTCIVGEEFAGCNVGRGIVPIRTKETEIILEFLKYQIDSKHLNDNIKALAKGITLIQLNMEDLREVTLIVPPIEKQKAFVEFAKQTDKSKLEVQKSLEKLETLKKALMQKYFG